MGFMAVLTMQDIGVCSRNMLRLMSEKNIFSLEKLRKILSGKGALVVSHKKKYCRVVYPLGNDKVVITENPINGGWDNGISMYYRLVGYTRPPLEIGLFYEQRCYRFMIRPMTTELSGYTLLIRDSERDEYTNLPFVKLVNSLDFGLVLGELERLGTYAPKTKGTRVYRARGL